MNRGEYGYRFLDPAALARVSGLALVARGVVEGFISGLHASPFRGFSVEFAEHRKYCAGDNLRHLDWRTLARTDRLFVKQYEQETNLQVQIVLDASGSMLYHRAGGPSKFEYGARLAAVLACLMIRQQDAVGLTVFAGQIRLAVPPGSAAIHFGEMMRRLEMVAAELDRRDAHVPGDGTDLGGTLTRVAERSRRRQLIVVISDLYDDADRLHRALARLRHRRHEVIVLQVLDRDELNFPWDETTRFWDLETGEEIQVDPKYVRAEYCQAVRRFVDETRARCAQRQIDHVLVDTSVPYELVLSRYLAQRSGL